MAHSQLLRQVAPTLAALLSGPLAAMAVSRIKSRLGSEAPGKPLAELLRLLLSDPQHIKKLQTVDSELKQELKGLNVDPASGLPPVKTIRHSGHSQLPQIILSVLFLAVYFILLSSMLVVEASDTINMKKGDNSLIGEIQILFGVLTAGVGQILGYWFGGTVYKREPPQS
ncbi:hypothetical protein [Gallaecimonas pentaromativorans]|uniref:hypothetical protein n=1 Tax=Gallaecimonas pentaromativorans TaxID=584787 RepID=UPI003A8EDAE4